MKKLPIIVLIIVLVALGGCNKDSIEYRYDIERFVGDYQTFDFYMGVIIHDYTPEGTSYEFNWLIYGITENGYYERDSNTNEIMFREVKLDANVVKSVNETIDMVGDKLSLEKDKINFSTISLGIKDKGYSDIGTDCLLMEMDIAKSDLIFMWVEAYYRHNKDKTLKISTRAKTTAIDDKEYTYSIAIFMQKK